MMHVTMLVQMIMQTMMHVIMLVQEMIQVMGDDDVHDMKLQFTFSYK